MMVVHFSSTDVAEAAGMPYDTVDRWVGDGHIAPLNRVKGTGNNRYWTIPQVVGVAMGAKLRRQSEMRCQLKIVARVFRFIADMTRDELEEAFSEGRTHLWPFTHDLKLAPPWSGADPDECNVQQVYHEVLAVLVPRALKRYNAKIEVTV